MILDFEPVLKEETMPEGIVANTVFDGGLVSSVNSGKARESVVNTERINLGRIIVTTFCAHIASMMPVNGVATNAWLPGVKEFNVAHVKVFEALGLDYVSPVEILVEAVHVNVVPAPVIVGIGRVGVCLFACLCVLTGRLHHLAIKPNISTQQANISALVDTC